MFIPSLDERPLGEPLTEDGEPVTYDRALPLLAQQVLDLGFELPNPYGIQLIGYWQEQDLELDKLSIAINGGQEQPIEFVDFGVPSVSNSSEQLKLDAWLFPFMNVYTSIGKFRGDGTIPLAIEGRDLLDFLGLGGLCGGGPFEPAFCERLLTATARPDYRGESITLGVNLAAGWDDYFVTLPISHAWTDVDIVSNSVTAWNISPRIGRLIDLKPGLGSIAAYLGATWLDSEVDLAGTVAFDTSSSGIDGLDDLTTIDYVIRQRNKDQWNYLAGFSWEINKRWMLQAEAGFGGSRENYIGSITYRW
ncbi:MAG: hypothetical protein AAGI72_20115 [Pseudomonadota bacterium]